MKLTLKLNSFFLFAVLYLFAFSQSASAAFFSSGTNLTLPKDNPIDETAFIAGEYIVVDSEINGDLYCAGRSIIVNGNIKGDIICAGQSIKVNGVVDGNVRVIAQDVEISGAINRNITTLSQNLILSKDSIVLGDIFFGVSQVDLRGSLGRDLAGAGEQVIVSGSLLRNAQVTASRINITNTATIGGDVDYYIEETGSYTQSSPQNVSGSVTRHEIVREDSVALEERIKSTSLISEFISKSISILSFIILASLLIYFTPSKTEKVVKTIKEKPVKMFFLGLGISIISPFVFILAMITVVGTTSAFFVIILYILSMIISSLYASILVGRLLSAKLRFNKSKSPYIDAVTGCLTVGIIGSVPVFGWIVSLALYLSGLGAIFLSYLPTKHHKSDV